MLLYACVSPASLPPSSSLQFWPFQSRESSHWTSFTQNGYVVGLVNGSLVSYDNPGGDQYLVDETNPNARAAVFDAFMAGYGNLGIKTVWMDAAEPEVRASFRQTVTCSLHQLTPSLIYLTKHE